MDVSQMFCLTLSSCLSTVHYCKPWPGMQVTRDIVVSKYLQGLSRHQDDQEFHPRNKSLKKTKSRDV